ncbi:MAG: YtxH domain-containing protein [Anaerolineales bacterium]|nr:YtxH domain-containing protein [Anaerolineales bacterium]
MTDRDDFGAFLVGFVVGGLTGAVVSLLFAPQSGEETRTLIKDKSIELRDKAAEQAEAALTKAQSVADSARVRGKDAIEGVKKAVARKNPAEPTAKA